MYLEKQIAGYGAWEEMQKRGRAEKYDYDTMLKFLGSVLKGTEELDRPGMAGRMRASELGIPVPLEEILPEQYGEAIRPYGETMAGQAEALGMGESFIKKMGVATQLLGSKPAMDLLEQQRKTIAGREAREISREKTRLGWAELGVKGEKLTKKQQDERLKDLAGKEKIFMNQLKSIKDPFSGYVEDIEDEPKAENLEAKIAQTRKEQLDIRNQRLGKLEKKKCDKIISKLRGAGKNIIKALENNKEQLKKEYNLTEEEYQYIRLNL